VEINLSEVVAEVSAEFDRCERALLANDIPSLSDFFWCDPRALRYSVAATQHGHAEIAASRLARLAKDLERVLFGTVVTTFGRDVATANTEFRRTESGRLGRQSQTWVRFPEGWRIVAAHVSYADSIDPQPNQWGNP
jgi:hypothetical protein